MGGAFSSSSSSGGGGTNIKTKKAPPPGSGISATDRAVLDLKNARDRLQKYKNRLELDDAKLVERARQAKAEGKTKAALNLLKIRKIKTREVETVEAQLLNVLQMVQTIDSKQNEAQVLAAMKKGKDTLQRMHEETTVEDVLNLMDEIHEQNELEREINAVFEGAPSLSVEDEAAVEAELEALMTGSTATTTTTTTTSVEDLPTVPDTPLMPQVPSNKLPEPIPTATSDERVALAS